MKRKHGWYVADRDTYMCWRGPYDHREPAEAVSVELRRESREANFWVLDSETMDRFDLEFKKLRKPMELPA